MVSALFNDARRYLVPDIFKALRDEDIISRLIPHVAVQGPEDIMEYQFNTLKHNKGAYISEVKQWDPKDVEINHAKARAYLVQKDSRLDDFNYHSMAGPYAQRKAQIAQEFSLDIMEAREEVSIIGYSLLAHGYANALFGLQSTTGDSASKPCSCEGTKGTAETGSSWAGAQRTTEALAVDIGLLLFDLANCGFIRRTQDGKYAAKTLTLLMHPLAVQRTRMWKTYNGSAYNDRTIAEELKMNGIDVVPTRAIDTDYAGAEDGTTQIALVPDISDNHAIGVVYPLRQDPWTEYSKGEWSTKFHQKQVQFSVPRWDGTQYVKGVAQSTITPWNNSA